MPRRIDGTLATGGRVVDDSWVTVVDAAGLDAISSDAPLIVASAVYRAHRDALRARPGPLGVLLAASDDPASIADELDRVDVVAIDFPKFTDGRGYSIARLLRERHGWRGTIRAQGDVLRDQLFYLLRCGFDSFAMKHQDRGEEGLRDALAAFEDFSDGYQSSVERAVPWFRRRAAAGVA